LVLSAGGVPEHRSFADFPSLLREGDVLVLNETRVIRARLHVRRPNGAPAELLLLRPRERAGYDPSAREWLALVRPGRALRRGAHVQVGDVELEIVDALPDGPRVVRFPESVDLEALLEEHGELPLPPYVGEGDEARAQRYQTVFARVPGSVAAPTASLHFTPEILEQIRARGVTLAPLVLDVGIGTFRPMAAGPVAAHHMHAERYAIGPEAAAAVNRARAEGRRVVAAGTTVVRALEGAAGADGFVPAGAGETALFIRPGYRFRVVDALLTNFHLPQSTLLVLVSAFLGYERTRAAYDAAIARNYRFFSFGDAMFAERAEVKPKGGDHG